ncbi:ankyrin repeat domain-containing protein [Flavobacterium branchiophilum]|nr:ankyrin repeat domain-containing protein [Flavobacterium branchiophilum]
MTNNMACKKILFIFVVLISINVFSQTKNIFDIARKGTVLEMSDCYRQNPSCVDALNEQQMSVLILACYKGNTAVAQFLIAHKANVNYVSEYGTALTAAVFRNDVHLVEVLLKNKANPNLTDTKGMTPLMYAVQNNNSQMVSILLDYKADKSLVNSENKTAFEYATTLGNEQILKLLKL